MNVCINMKDRVIQYLMAHYGISESAALVLVNQADDQVKDAQMWNSQPYYVADPLADEAGLTHNNPCSACDDEVFRGPNNRS